MEHARTSLHSPQPDEFDAQIDKAIDLLFVPAPRKSCPTPREEESARDELKVIFPPEPTERRQASELERLQEVVLSLEWELSRENLSEFEERLQALKDARPEDRFVEAVVRMVLPVCRYLRLAGAEATPRGAQFPSAAARTLESLVDGALRSPGEKKAAVARLLGSYRLLQSEVSREGRAKSAAPPAPAQRSDDAPSAPAWEPLPAEGASCIAEACAAESKADGKASPESEANDGIEELEPLDEEATAGEPERPDEEVSGRIATPPFLPDDAVEEILDLQAEKSVTTPARPFSEGSGDSPEELARLRTEMEAIRATLEALISTVTRIEANVSRAVRTEEPAFRARSVSGPEWVYHASVAGRPVALAAESVAGVFAVSPQRLRRILKRGEARLRDFRSLFQSLKRGLSGPLGELSTAELRRLAFPVAPGVGAGDAPRCAVLLSDGVNREVLFTDTLFERRPTRPGEHPVHLIGRRRQEVHR
jgi:hypothetical protein